MLAMHLRRAIPPRTTARDALAAKRGIHPFPNIGAQIVESIHASLGRANAGRTDASAEPRGAIQGKRCCAAIVQAIRPCRAFACWIGIGHAGLEGRGR